MKKKLIAATGALALLLLLFQPAMASISGALGSDEDQENLLTTDAVLVADADGEDKLADDPKEEDVLEDTNGDQIPDVVEGLDAATVASLREMKLGYGQIAQIFSLAEKYGIAFDDPIDSEDTNEDYDDFQDIVDLFTKHDDINGGYGQAKKVLEDKAASTETLTDEQGTDEETSDIASPEKVNKGQTMKAAKAQIKAAKAKK